MVNVKICPRCGNEETQVFEARVFHGVFRRRRICTKCKYKYDTAEILFWDAVTQEIQKEEKNG